jgi:general secretion pathway protein G
VTLLELIIAAAMAAVIAAIALPSWVRHKEKTLIAQAAADIRSLEVPIERFAADNGGRLPRTLADIGRAGMLDPWGTPYQYLPLDDVNGNGQARKDKNLVPLNTDYDLYSMGPDQDSRPPVTASMSRDDIVRAYDGRVVAKVGDLDP